MSLHDTLPGGSLDVEVYASSTLASYQGPAAQFVANRGPNHVLRCSRRMVMPTVGPSAAIPAPWDDINGYSVRLRLSPAVQGTDNLCLELVTRAVAGTATPRFDVDAVSVPVTAASREIGSSCGMNGLVPRTDTQTAFLIPGSTALLRLADVRPGRIALSLIGFSMQTWGGIPLPLPLDQAGAPGCSIYNDWLHLAATVTATPVPGWHSGEAYRRFQLPLDPTLLGGIFYSQWLILEQGINPLGVVTTHGLEARLASAFPSFEIATVESHDPQAPEGRVLQHFVPVLRLLP